MNEVPKRLFVWIRNGEPWRGRCFGSREEMNSVTRGITMSEEETHSAECYISAAALRELVAQWEEQFAKDFDHSQRRVYLQQAVSDVKKLLEGE